MDFPFEAEECRLFSRANFFTAAAAQVRELLGVCLAKFSCNLRVSTSQQDREGAGRRGGGDSVKQRAVIFSCAERRVALECPGIHM